MGRSMTGGGGAAVAEVATPFPGRCLGATEPYNEILKDLKEEEESLENSEIS